MRLSDWRATAPRKDSMSPKVMSVLGAALELLGADSNPDCWVVWGDDPAVRYTVLVPIDSGLAQVNVRVNVPAEGPRAQGKLIRWNRVQTGELSVELQGGHRLINFQIENNVLRGRDETADILSDFVLIVYDAIDGRSAPIRVVAQGPDKGPVVTPKARTKPPVPQLPAPRGADS
jgi:hypothetical protein